MHIKVLALDLDGTLAENDRVSQETWEALCKLKDAGFVLILVTGRSLNSLMSVRPFETLCEAIVAENGAVIFYPGSSSVVMPFGRLTDDISNSIQHAGIPYEKGMAIIGSWVPHDHQIARIISGQGGGATVEYNRGAVMVLPPGATKGTGLLSALYELGYSPKNVMACGDGENDRSLFEQAEIGIAVENAAPGIKKIADHVLSLPDGRGLRSLFKKLLNNEIPTIELNIEKKIQLDESHGKTVAISPYSLVGSNTAIFGSSGSGKSWLAGLLAEKLLKQNYQLCIIDPEGEYRGFKAFPHALLLGGEIQSLPTVPDILTMLEYSDISLILDLSQISLERKIEYTELLLEGLISLKKRRGKPHWFLIDESHYFCPPENNRFQKLLLQRMDEGGLCLISYRPGLIHPEILKKVSNWLVTRQVEGADFELLKETMPEFCQNLDFNSLKSLRNGQAFVCFQNGLNPLDPAHGVVNFKVTERRIPHIRHLHKYLRAPLSPAKRFYFHTQESYDGPKTAASLWEFMEVIPEIPDQVLKYHLERKDFEKWIQKTLNDRELAKRIRKISRRSFENGQLKLALQTTVRNRLEELSEII